MSNDFIVSIILFVITLIIAGLAILFGALSDKNKGTKKEENYELAGYVGIVFTVFCAIGSVGMLGSGLYKDRLQKENVEVIAKEIVSLDYETQKEINGTEVISFSNTVNSSHDLFILTPFPLQFSIVAFL